MSTQTRPKSDGGAAKDFADAARRKQVQAQEEAAYKQKNALRAQTARPSEVEIPEQMEEKQEEKDDSGPKRSKKDEKSEEAEKTKQEGQKPSSENLKPKNIENKPSTSETPKPTDSGFQSVGRTPEGEFISSGTKPNEWTKGMSTGTDAAKTGSDAISSGAEAIGEAAANNIGSVGAGGAVGATGGGAVGAGTGGAVGATAGGIIAGVPTLGVGAIPGAAAGGTAGAGTGGAAGAATGGAAGIAGGGAAGAASGGAAGAATGGSTGIAGGGGIGAASSSAAVNSAQAAKETAKQAVKAGKSAQDAMKMAQEAAEKAKDAQKTISGNADNTKEGLVEEFKKVGDDPIIKTSVIIAFLIWITFSWMFVLPFIAIMTQGTFIRNVIQVFEFVQDPVAQVKKTIQSLKGKVQAETIKKLSRDQRDALWIINETTIQEARKQLISIENIPLLEGYKKELEKLITETEGLQLELLALTDEFPNDEDRDKEIRKQMDRLNNEIMNNGNWIQETAGEIYKLQFRITGHDDETHVNTNKYGKIQIPGNIPRFYGSTKDEESNQFTHSWGRPKTISFVVNVYKKSQRMFANSSCKYKTILVGHISPENNKSDIHSKRYIDGKDVMIYAPQTLKNADFEKDDPNCKYSQEKSDEFVKMLCDSGASQVIGNGANNSLSTKTCKVYNDPNFTYYWLVRIE